MQRFLVGCAAATVVTLTPAIATAQMQDSRSLRVGLLAEYVARTRTELSSAWNGMGLRAFLDVPTSRAVSLQVTAVGARHSERSIECDSSGDPCPVSGAGLAIGPRFWTARERNQPRMYGGFDVAFMAFDAITAGVSWRFGGLAGVDKEVGRWLSIRVETAVDVARVDGALWGAHGWTGFWSLRVGLSR